MVAAQPRVQMDARADALDNVLQHVQPPVEYPAVLGVADALTAHLDVQRHA